MRIAQEIGRLQTGIAHSERIEEFIVAIKHMMINRDTYRDLGKVAREAGLSQRAIDFMTKAGVAAQSTSDSALAPHPLAASFLASLVGTGIFETLLGSMVRLPLRTTVNAVTAAITGATVAEASAKPISRISVAASDLDQAKATAQLTVTSEFLKTGGELADTFLRRELASGIIKTTDAQFLTLITSGSPTSFASSGVTGLGARQDLRTLLQTVPTGTASRLFWIVTPTISKAWSVLPDSNGAAAFPDARYDGGSVAGVPILSSDQAVAGEIILVDASAIAAGAGDLIINTSNMASVQMDGAPDSPTSASTNMISLWQLGETGVRAERLFGARLLRSDAIAKVTGVSYAGNSPS